MDLDGKNLQRLTNTPNWNGSPVWSPDGSTIYFSRTGTLVAHGVRPIAGETQAVEEILGHGPLLSPDFPITLAVPDVSGDALALYLMRHTSGLAPHPHSNEVIVTIEDAKGTDLLQIENERAEILIGSRWSQSR